MESQFPTTLPTEKAPWKIAGNTMRRLGQAGSDRVGDYAETILPPSSSPFLAELNEVARSIGHEAPEWLLTEGVGKVIAYPEKAGLWVESLLGKYTQSKLLKQAAKGAAGGAVEPPYGPALRGETRPSDLARDRISGVLGGAAKGGLKAMVPWGVSPAGTKGTPGRTPQSQKKARPPRGPK